MCYKHTYIYTCTDIHPPTPLSLALRTAARERFICCLLKEACACRSAAFRAFSMPFVLKKLRWQNEGGVRFVNRYIHARHSITTSVCARAHTHAKGGRQAKVSGRARTLRRALRRLDRLVRRLLLGVVEAAGVGVRRQGQVDLHL